MGIKRLYHTFWWSPEGRPLVTYTDMDTTTARVKFKREYPQYAKYMGEVYITHSYTLCLHGHTGHCPVEVK